MTSVVGKVPSTGNSASGNAKGFTGRDRVGNGLLYYRNRMYSPPLGRFISEDPLGWEAGPNFFAYCGNDPVNLNDPLGLLPTFSNLIWLQKYINYRQDATKAEIGKWQNEGLVDARDNHDGGGIYDYKHRRANELFNVHNTWLNASQFGNYAAGYSGYYNGTSLGLWGVQAGGHAWEFWEDNERLDKEGAFLGDDGGIDKWLIMLGAVDAYMDLRKGYSL